ncbi:MAG: ferritin-like domain-containing protein [Actinomycetota bacterium]|nr:ferritin-like domain-containing protein [Actinomycetota bacterium]
MEITSIRDVYADQLGDLRSAETQLIAALPKMANAASDPDLKQAFTNHLEQTRGHLDRLQRIISEFPASVPDETCEAMKGLVTEGDEIVNATGDAAAKDAALIAAAQRVEHYEIAAYGTARTLARQLDLGEASGLLDQTLDEESDADKLLTKLATGGLLGTGINQAAQA